MYSLQGFWEESLFQNQASLLFEITAKELV